MPVLGLSERRRCWTVAACRGSRPVQCRWVPGLRGGDWDSDASGASDGHQAVPPCCNCRGGGEAERAALEPQRLCPAGSPRSYNEVLRRLRLQRWPQKKSGRRWPGGRESGWVLQQKL